MTMRWNPNVFTAAARPARVRAVRVTAVRVGARTTLAAGALLAAAGAHAEIVETRALEDSVPIDAAAPLHVVVDDVFGSIKVTAHDAATVEMHATETVRAKSRFDLGRPRSDVTLRTERDGGEVAFLVRRPDGQCDCSSNHWDGYVVEYDIELEVPRGASLDLSTVNEGDIVVDGVEGDFEIANVNGAIRLGGLRGSGHIRTVNGPIEAVFAHAPAGPVSFKTINGRVEAAFPDDLSADLRFKTMHGEIWTDFKGEPLAAAVTREHAQRGNGWVLRSSSQGGIRVGNGGPTHEFETLNGDIVVRKADSAAGRTGL
jgi:hypothetical protein